MPRWKKFSFLQNYANRANYIKTASRLNLISRDWLKLRERAIKTNSSGFFETFEPNIYTFLSLTKTFLRVTMSLINKFYL